MNSSLIENDLWERYLAFLRHFGEVTAYPSEGVRVTRGRWVSFARMSKCALYRYVADYVTWRIDHGLDDGLDDGLPLPLTDSLGECIGSQHKDRATYALVGLDFRPIDA